ncbi:MAG: sigma-70 family RNA polymerase sigma factor [Terriglobales bacterium]|jgi:RNA polymerase sigma-70 factor (ECF subfamily)
MDASVTIRLAGLAIPNRDGHAASSPVATPAQEVQIPDEALMAQICDGSREALAVLFRRYARLVRTVAMRILRDDSEADDLLQDVFLFVHRNCSIFDSSRAGLRSWIVQMTYHRAIDRRRYLNSRHFYTRLDLDGVADLLDTRSESREDKASFISLVGNTTIHGLLDTLTEDQRNTLSLHFFEGYTFAEIAAKLDQSLGNIRNHYYRGLDKLRKQMFPGKLPGRNGCGRK